MVLAFIAGQMVGRRGHGTSSLSCAAIAMALLDPSVTGQLAYQLSVAAVLGIRIVYPYLRYVIDVMASMRGGHRRAAPVIARLRPLYRSMRDLTAMTLTVQLVTLPITTEAFGELSLIAPLANLIAAPPISLMTILGVASIVLLPVPHASEVLIAACTPIGELRVDGGPTRNGYLMQFQADLLGIPVRISDSEELSGIGAAYAAGLAAGVYDEGVFGVLKRASYEPAMEAGVREQKYAGWLGAVRRVRS